MHSDKQKHELKIWESKISQRRFDYLKKWCV